jgi:AraC family transcriptional activator of pobA
VALAQGGAGTMEAAGRAPFWLAEEMLELQREWRERDPLFLALAEALVRTLTHADRDQEAGALADRRLHRFRHLVELHYREHRPLDFYAGALGMTRRTLSRLTAAASIVRPWKSSTGGSRSGPAPAALHQRQRGAGGGGTGVR